MALRLALSVGLVVGSLALGQWLGRVHRLTSERASGWVRFVVRCCSPLVLGLSIWRMDFRQFDPWVLPLIGLIVSFASLPPAWLLSRRMQLPPAQAGSFLTCAMFSNVGYFGAFVAFAVFGEFAYALCLLYFTFFSASFYVTGFWLAGRFGEHVSSGPQLVDRSLQWYPLAGMAAGFILSLAGVPRWSGLELVNRVLIPFDTAVYLVAIGSQLTFENPLPYLRPCLAMAAVKFLWSPLVGLSLAALFGVKGLARIVVVLEASTPVAVSPLILPLLFGLDRRLANSMFLVTTAIAVAWFLVLIPVAAGW